MGTDVSVKLIYGFKIMLSKAFELNLISPNIMDEDDWQLISEVEYKNEIVETHVKSEVLKVILESGWDVYILTSTQEESNPEKSYMFIYNKKTDLVSSGLPDYVTGIVDVNYDGVFSDVEKTLKDKHPQLNSDLKYDIHWIVESSW